MRFAVRDLSAGYGSRIVARGVSFELGSGSLVAVLGVNGSGKTTIIRTMAGFLPPLGGKVEVGGIGLREFSLRTRSRWLAYVPQTSQAAWPFSVREVVATARYSRTGAFGAFGAQDRRAVDEAIVTMGLGGLESRPFTTLSGGEARRVLVARALAQETPFILLDEPCAHLDPGRQIELMESLSALAAAGKGLLVSLHDVNLARRYARTIVLVMPDGSAVTGSPDRILVPATLQRAYNTEFLFGDHEEYGRYVIPMATRAGFREDREEIGSGPPLPCAGPAMNGGSLADSGLGLASGLGDSTVAGDGCRSIEDAITGVAARGGVESRIGVAGQVGAPVQTGVAGQVGAPVQTGMAAKVGVSGHVDVSATTGRHAPPAARVAGKGGAGSGSGSGEGGKG